MKLHEIKKLVVLNRLEHFKGNRAKTADSLGIQLKALHEYLEVLGVEPGRMPSPEMLDDLTHSMADFFSSEWFSGMLTDPEEEILAGAA